MALYTPIPEVPELEQQEEQQGPSPVEQKRRAAHAVISWGFLLSFAAVCLLFGTYMAAFYLRSMAENKLSAWDRSTPGMFHKERWDSNWLGMGIHFVGGAYMMLFGPLQFVKAIRRNQNWMPLHRWNGRLTVLGSILTAVGGMYYTAAVGTTFVRISGRQANWTTMVFGLCMLICGFQTYRHAAWTKKIDQHKLWAYRVAGLCFGNIFFRMYLQIVSICFDADGTVYKLAWDISGYIYFIPFLILAGEIWKREQDEKAVPSVTSIALTAFLLLLFLVVAYMLVFWWWVPLISLKNLDPPPDL